MTYLDQVIPYLYISDYDSASYVPLLIQHQIKHVILIAEHEKSLEVLAEMKDAGITHEHIFVFDSIHTNILGRFPSFCAKVHEHRNQQESVLVHCMAGISRSATFVLAYMIWLAYQDPSMASTPTLDFCPVFHRSHIMLKQIRPIIQPNSGFQKQLIQWELQLCSDT